MRTNLIDQTDLSAHFATGPIRHTLTFGAELGHEEDRTFRYTNPLGAATETSPTSLLDPDPHTPAAFQQRRIHNIIRFLAATSVSTASRSASTATSPIAGRSSPAIPHLDGKTIASNTANIVGKRLADVAHNAVNLWTEYYVTDHLELGIGGNYLSKRFADLANTASLPSYVLVDAMASYRLNSKIEFRVNVNNLTDKLAFQSVYYANSEENHVIPVPGRTVLFSAAFHY